MVYGKFDKQNASTTYAHPRFKLETLIMATLVAY